MPGLYLDSGQTSGWFIGPVVQSSFPATEAILSVNIGSAEADDCGVAAWVSCQRADGSWSSWYRVLHWGTVDADRGTTADNFGQVAVDILKIQAPADRWRYRVAWHDAEGILCVRRIALNLYADGSFRADDAAESAVEAKTVLPVPFYSQWQIDGFPAGRVCSPTALAMVAAFHGVHTTPEEVARLAYDAHHQIYGNWAMNILAASRLGLDAWVDRGTDVAYLHDMLARRQPIVTSIAYGDGELDGAPVSASNGHLVVVAGFDKTGQVVVRDPAARGDDVWMTYDRDQFIRAWLGHGGVTYRVAGAGAQ